MLRIDTILKLQDISTQELASRMSVSPQYVSEVVNEKKNITLSGLTKFAEALQVPLAALFNGYKDKTFVDGQFSCPKCGTTLKVELTNR